MNYSHIQERLKELAKNADPKKQTLTEKKLLTYNKINELKEELRQQQFIDIE